MIVILRPASSSPEYLSQAEDTNSTVVAAEPRQIWGLPPSVTVGRRIKMLKHVTISGVEM